MADKKSLVNIDFGGASSIKNIPSVNPAASDCLAITDYSDGGKVKKGPVIGSNDGTFLRRDGSWATPDRGVASITAGTGITITNNGNGSYTVSSSNHVYKATSSSTVYLSNALFKTNHVYEIYPRNGNSTFTVYWKDVNNNTISWTCSKLTVRVITKRTSHSSSYKQAIMLIWGDDFNYGSSSEDPSWFAQPRRQEVYGTQSNFYFSGYFNIYDMSN